MILIECRSKQIFLQLNEIFIFIESKTLSEYPNITIFLAKPFAFHYKKPKPNKQKHIKCITDLNIHKQDKPKIYNHRKQLNSNVIL